MSLRIDSRAVAGSAIVILGSILTVLSLTLRQAWSVERFWPMLVVGFGVSRIVERSGRFEGWLLLAVGGWVQLSNIGVVALPGHEVVRYWPLTVVLAGVWEVVFSRRAGAIVEGAAIVFLGVWLQSSYFGAVHIGSYRLWPVVLVAIGGVMVWRSFRPQRLS